jgi:hypothetical protein
MKKTAYLLISVLILFSITGCLRLGPVPGSDKGIVAFSFEGITGTVAIDGAYISITVPEGTDVESLVAIFNSTGTSVKVGNIEQISGTTANNFANPITYTVTAEDGTTQEYVVTIIFSAAEPAIVDIAAIPGVTAPVTGATPETTITATSQFTGTVAWSPVDATFAGSTVYTSTITLTPTAGYTLNGVPEDFFTVAGATAANAADTGVVTAVFPATSAVVDIAAIPGVTTPVAGATPETTITATSQYTGTVSWSPADATFAGSTVYTSTITLTPTAGYTLTGVPEDFFTVAGATAANAADTGVVTAVFPATSAIVDITAIPDVTPPVTGATPVTTITATSQFTGTVAWSPVDATFAGSTVYTATITLTPTAGYTLTGVPEDFFTVAGATAANAADTGVVTAVFPATSAIVDIAAIPDVTAPVTGAAPVTTITATSQFTGTVAWSPADGTFVGSTVYTATITLTPTAGYTLTGVPENIFTVAGAMATNAADTGVVTAVFAATEPAVVDIAAIPGVTVPVFNEIPVSTITATSQYTGTVTWSPPDVPFASFENYTATITLTPTAGYTMTGILDNFFTVAGATATNAADTGVVTAVFPQTDGPAE